MKKIYFPVLWGLLILAGCTPKPKVQWQNYTPELMQQARDSGQPVVAYFSAAWCPPCYELRDKTFKDLRVIEALEPFQRIRVDMSYKHSKSTQEIGEEFDIAGLPTVLFFDAKGNPLQEFNITGFVPAEVFLEVIAKYRSKNPNFAFAPASSATNSR
jgi:thioredoxin:protein disulfide reductase